MLRFFAAALLAVCLFGCGQADLSSAAAINANKEIYMDEVVRLEGKHVKRNRNSQFISTGRIDYLVLEDDSGRIRVWYDTADWHCPPRLGAHLSVAGKVVAAGSDGRLIFAARSMSIENEPPLADNEVRMCQLSLDEQRIESESGPAGLRDYWREQGMPERVLIYD